MYISVIVPFYYGNSHIEHIVTNVEENAKYLQLKHPDVKVELIFVNDSPEVEMEIENQKKESAESGIQIKALQNDKNRGIHYSRVQGLKKAEGKYVVFLDQDDELDKHFLRMQFEAIRENDVVVCNGVHKYDTHEVVLYKNRYQLECTKQLKKYVTIRQQIASPGQCLIRKEAIPQEWYRFIMQKNGADDYFLWILMLSKGRKFEVNGKVLYNHVITGENCSADLQKMDCSVDEMVELLWKVPYIDMRTKRKMRRCNRYKQNFRYANPVWKILYSLQNLDLALLNVIFKVKSANTRRK